MKLNVALIAIIAVLSVFPLSSKAQSISANAGQNATTCAGSSITLGGNPSASGGVGGYTYLWQPSSFLDDSLAANPKSRPFVQTTYVLTVTDTAGNSAKDTVVISVDTIPVISFTDVDTPYCKFQARDTILASPGGGYFYGTAVYLNTFDPFTAGPGMHYMKYSYTDGNGCVGLDSVKLRVLTPLSISIDPIDTSNCENDDPIPLIANPSGGMFGGPGVLNDTLFPNLTGPGLMFPIHYTITDSATGCLSATELFHNIYAPPQINFAGMPNPVCTGDGPVTLNANPPGGTFSGDFVHNNTFYPDSAGVGTQYIYYTVSNKDSCTSLDSMDIIIFQSPTVTFESPGDTFCQGDPSVSLSASPSGGTFSGDGIITTSFHPVAAGPGTHTLYYSYTDGQNCTVMDSVTVFVEAGPTATVSRNGSVLTASGGNTYEWYKNSTQISGASGSTYTMTTSGTYQAKAIDEQGCSDMSDTINYVQTGITPVDNHIFNIYPNPVSGTLYIQADINESVELVIYDVFGTQLYKKTLILTSSPKSIDVSMLAAGTYLIELKGQETNLKQTIIKK